MKPTAGMQRRLSVVISNAAARTSAKSRIAAALADSKIFSNDAAHGRANELPDEVWPLVLSLRENDIELERAFKFFGLQPNDPYAWYQVAHLFAYVLFSNPKKGGRREEWNQVRYCELIFAVHRRRQQNPRLSDRRACEQIAKDKASPAYFRKAGAQGLRKQLRLARNPVHNEMLRYLIEKVASKLLTDTKLREDLIRTKSISLEEAARSVALMLIETTSLATNPPN